MEQKAESSYFLMKNRNNTMTIWNKWKIRLGLFKPKRAYDHILMLGYNCEIAFQFFSMYHFLQSNLFAWSYAYSLKDTAQAIAHLDEIGAEGFLPPDPLWQCRRTHIRFHGRQPGFSADIEKELSQRTEYLKKKFLQAGSSGQKILCIIKVRTETADVQREGLKAVYQALRRRIKGDFDFLVVTEQNNPLSLQDLPFENIFLRRVAFFAPEADVTNLRKSAAGAWQRIFAEFGPAFHLSHKKHFKFEEK